MESKEISRAVIKRLPRYYRYLGELLESGVERISSNELSDRMQVTASQIRQDLKIGKILGLDKMYHMIIIGAGNLGQALANYAQFEKWGFKVTGIFDVNPVLRGVSVRNVPIRMVEELPEYLKENETHIAALTLPKEHAREMAELVVANGVKAIWNFAHTDLKLPDDVVVESVHLSESLMQLSYNMSNYKKTGKNHSKQKKSF